MSDSSPVSTHYGYIQDLGFLSPTWGSHWAFLSHGATGHSRGSTESQETFLYLKSEMNLFKDTRWAIYGLPVDSPNDAWHMHAWIDLLKLHSMSPFSIKSYLLNKKNTFCFLLPSLSPGAQKAALCQEGGGSCCQEELPPHPLLGREWVVPRQHLPKQQLFPQWLLGASCPLCAVVDSLCSFIETDTK